MTTTVLLILIASAIAFVLLCWRVDILHARVERLQDELALLKAAVIDANGARWTAKQKTRWQALRFAAINIAGKP